MCVSTQFQIGPHTIIIIKHKILFSQLHNKIFLSTLLTKVHYLLDVVQANLILLHIVNVQQISFFDADSNLRSVCV